MDQWQDLSETVALAKTGDAGRLAALVRAIQDDIFHLSMRMLVRIEDAEDATQEILILLITKLSTYEGRSSFRTWSYRVAMNYLITSKKIRAKEMGLTFDWFKQDLAQGLVDDSPLPEDVAAVNEVRVVCTMAMLLCLDLKHRAAYVVGCILEFSHEEAAEILEISKDNFRQRLSRARKEVEAFTSESCGLVNPQAPCSCPGRLPIALKQGRVSRPLLYSIGSTQDYETVKRDALSLAQDLRTLKLQQSTRRFESPRDFGETICNLLERP